LPILTNVWHGLTMKADIVQVSSLLTLSSSQRD
jgi:hypothetical protein